MEAKTGIESRSITAKYFADVNEDGNIIGFYFNEIHGENIPITALAISFEEWQLYSVNANLYKLDGGLFREKTEAEIKDELAQQPPVPETIEQKVVRLEEENIEMMLALTEAYEVTVEQQTTLSAQLEAIEVLNSRLEALESRM
ncbi:hypothetical protein [Paenibacillus radicis (ex Gao et al. 2016)]|uniref:Uncharacterized protein n=1 Tax=Paenibacillus radicis (ex Gao et al. 2016) TaxID=1737354 RepID=A0A917M6V7_9BACL|nr:hypothetical protein [Paenibacillus radicis (ex Gao et al. 2016)]GGG81708.1 hypothetical protein GCM10010918_43760 [Paenibacillus radicis (ex Gao et al. 2016)]